MSSENTDLQIYEIRAKDLLDEDGVRFAGIINEDGNLISGGFKKGVLPLESDQEKLESFLEFVSKISLRKQYDDSLGPINYLVARRNKTVLISFPFPLSKFLLLISAEPTVNIENLASKVIKVFGGPSLSSD
ncbi:MAG: hypothetical protein OEM77_04880 [Nitrosopumilus sp.]|nr:hypothetical protein [Nitrosopumilus sp.]MDH3736509.1 hypothetical protein [Nitrosopumilus sp.]MDH3823826.1 hypothetical protein [Nitrosopumilus sp.]MDH3834621.1 hypothetical protein [Nitrosopumilus sp.]